MKLIRFGKLHQEKPGAYFDEAYFDLSEFGEDYNEQFFETGGLDRVEKFIKENKGGLQKIPADARLGSPVARPSKIVCIGLNYEDHARETGTGLPSEPIIFYWAF